MRAKKQEWSDQSKDHDIKSTDEIINLRTFELIVIKLKKF